MRREVKTVLARWPDGQSASGLTALIYHRVGAGSVDELQVSPGQFAEQLRRLDGCDVVALDEAVGRLQGGDPRPSVVLTFDDGFADVYENAWPLLRARRLPFTIYLAAAYVGAVMDWPGSTARGHGPALTWAQLATMVDSGLCTVGNHTMHHVRPERLDVDELDACSAAVEQALGVRPRHFAFPWGVPVPALDAELRSRFVTAATGDVGRNRPGADLHRLRRVPVRRTDPPAFFAAKLTGRLRAERAYGRVVRLAKGAGLHA